MDSEMKQLDNCKSESCTEESDHESGKSSDEISGGRRFYECTFCKRGFTNAQALGGHMNIHRKEKAKEKPKAKKGSLISSKTQEESDQSQYYAIPFESNHQMLNYQFYYPPENPSFPTAYHNMINDFDAAQRSDHHRLSIDGSHNGSMMWNENEIDLELRL